MIWEKIGEVSNAELGFGGDESGSVANGAGDVGVSSSVISSVDGGVGNERMSDVGEIGISVDGVVRGNSEVRYAVRAIIFNEDGKICIIKSNKYGYMQLPGGGVEEGESLAQALKREAEEEGGCKIRDIHPLGYFIDWRGGELHKYNWSHQISFAFTAKLAGLTETSYTEYELAEGFVPVWLELDKALEEFRYWKDRVVSYTGKFANWRDSAILEYYLVKL